MGIESGRTLLRFRWLANRHPYSKYTTSFWSLVAPNSGMPVSKEFLHIAICFMQSGTPFRSSSHVGHDVSHDAPWLFYYRIGGMFPCPVTAAVSLLKLP